MAIGHALLFGQDTVEKALRDGSHFEQAGAQPAADLPLLGDRQSELLLGDPAVLE